MRVRPFSFLLLPLLLLGPGCATSTKSTATEPPKFAPSPAERLAKMTAWLAEKEDPAERFDRLRLGPQAWDDFIELDRVQAALAYASTIGVDGRPAMPELSGETPEDIALLAERRQNTGPCFKALLEQMVSDDSLLRRFDALYVMLPQRERQRIEKDDYVRWVAHLRAGERRLPPLLVTQRYGAGEMLTRLFYLGLDTRPPVFPALADARELASQQSFWSWHVLNACDRWAQEFPWPELEVDPLVTELTRVTADLLHARWEAIVQDFAVVDAEPAHVQERHRRLMQHLEITDRYLPHDKAVQVAMGKLLTSKATFLPDARKALYKSMLPRVYPEAVMRGVVEELITAQPESERDATILRLLDRPKIEPQIVAVLVQELHPSPGVSIQRGQNRQITEVLIAMGAQSVDPLIQRMTDRRMRHVVAPVLIEIGELSVEPLGQALSHEDEQVRIGAAMTLSRMPDLPDATRALLTQAREDESGMVRMYARRALTVDDSTPGEQQR